MKELTLKAYNKVSKKTAEFEHPSKGPDDCDECVFFEVKAPEHCLRVYGKITSEDWCKFFKSNGKPEEKE